jgi:tetratricopeptide (TPR) repeat protein
MGEPGKAIPLYEVALEKARRTKDAKWQCANLNGLATSYFCMGHVSKAKELTEEALVIARQNSLRLWLSNNLGILSNCHNDLGHTDKAIECLREALEVTRQTGQRALEAFRCLMLAVIHISEGQYIEALSLTLESKAISEVIDQPRLPSFCSFALAQIHYRTGDLPAARAAAESACENMFPENLHNSSVLLGMIALKQGEKEVARAAFQRAIERADHAVALNNTNANALDCKGLAQCGLALCDDHEQISLAVSTYRAARAINRHPGIIRNAVRWLDTLAILDSSALLEDARRAAGGESLSPSDGADVQAFTS